MDFRIVGPGRAGSSLRRALEATGWRCAGTLGRDDDPGDAAVGADLVVLAVPDDAIASVARSIEPGPAVLLHLSGVSTLDRLEPHPRRGSVHPLVSMPDVVTGAERLLAGATFAIAGDAMARRLVEQLGGTAIEVADDRRVVYHAAAAVASNHLVALCGQIERLAAAAEVPASIYWELMARSLDNVRSSGPADALTGPAARGDLATLAAHTRSIDRAEVPLYLALADAAAALAGRPAPSAELPAPQS